LERREEPVGGKISLIGYPVQLDWGGKGEVYERKREKKRRMDTLLESDTNDHLVNPWT